jgi:N4-(beta-N-acetylglucosaminyl)-L-asparaginase
VNIQELDPEDQSVGLGGFPNAEGVVQLDASVMHGPSRKAGAVAAIEGIATPSLVAKAVMDHTEHILLVGQDAKRFALSMGFREQNLLTEKSRQAWLQWKACNGLASTHERIPYTTGTINMLAVTGSGDMASATTTSGLSWKVPGRVGDSPIVGAGQYCDNTVGAAGSTGLGEANIKVCGAFLIVEFMRQGLVPEQACLKTIERVIAMTETNRLDKGRPLFDLQFYALRKDGAFGGATLYEGGDFAVADSTGARLVPFRYLLPRSDRPEMPPACRKAS